MEKTVLDFVTEQTHRLMDAPTCSAEARAAAEAWLKAVGTDRQADATKEYIAELEADIVTVEGLELFAMSAAGAKVFGEAHAKEVAEHARQIKAAGAKYCDCPACAAAEAILKKKEALLK